MVVNPKTKGLMILGRRYDTPLLPFFRQNSLILPFSDGVLNPSGVRFGSGEIYTALEQFSNVLDDTLCIGQRRPQDNNERVLLFLKMREGHRLTPQLEREIRDAIRTALSARHVPAHIFEIEEIPVSTFRFVCAMAGGY